YLRPGVWRALDMSFRHPGALIQELLTDEAGPALDTPPPVVLRPGETVPVGAADWLVLQVEDAGASPAPDAGSLVGMVTQTTEDARAPHMPAPTPLPDKPAPPTRPISPRDPGLQGFAFIQELTRRFEARPKKPVPVEKKTHHPAKQVELEAQYAERMQLWARELVDIRYNEEATWAHEMRDMAILEQLKAGNVPDFCRPDLASAWHPVRLDHPDRHISGIVYVLSDVLAVGNNEDYVRVPISGYTSQMIADHWGCCLPTSRVIRQAYVAADRKMVLHNFGTGLATMSNAALLWHDAIVQGRVESLAADPMLSELAEMAGRGGAAAEEAVLLLRAVVSAGLPD
ncbi:MAG TPA: hypothetical protein PKW90_29335, partial [Myxococcota bacterium]|nr:hypothetical protein [Myxococcota bacterium]